MKNSFGQSLSVTVFGESHGPYIGAVLDGLAPGIRIDDDYIRASLAKRRPSGTIGTARREADAYEIVSGAWAGFTTGTPLTILIPNEDTRSGDYTALADTPRPSHADYSAQCKYHGFQDVRGGGHFSGRLTAPLVAAGALVRSALLQKGIRIATHIARLGELQDAALCEETMDAVQDKSFPVIDEARASEMRAYIEEVRAEGDSVGGVLETLVVGMPAGVGEPMFDSMESTLSHMLFSIPAVKGVSFGAGFEFAAMKGSEANDPYRIKDGRIVTKTNHSGGIAGGITNGMPIRFRCVIKPTPSIFKPQESVSLSRMENCELSLKGRHDPAIVHRACAVVDAVTALVLADMLTVRYGTDVLATTPAREVTQ